MVSGHECWELTELTGEEGAASPSSGIHLNVRTDHLTSMDVSEKGDQCSWKLLILHSREPFLGSYSWSYRDDLATLYSQYDTLFSLMMLQKMLRYLSQFTV